ncbi:MAG: hypothetical protein H6729_03670 [Deltaproteobacteria bacterium]|nr:hypothetical protein [Deltaproteobacteria bacterium]
MTFTSATSFAKSTKPKHVAPPEKLPALRLTELEVRTLPQPVPSGPKRQPGLHRRVRVAVPADWTPEAEDDGRSIRLFGPSGEGRILIAVALSPVGLNEYLSELKRTHPSVAPSPPMAMDLPGIRPDLGERATRFLIDGPEKGEMVMIERNDAIVLMVTIVEPSAWPNLAKVLARCYPTVEVATVAAPEGRHSP